MVIGCGLASCGLMEIWTVPFIARDAPSRSSVPRPIGCRSAGRPAHRTLRPLAKLKELKQLIIGPNYFKSEYDWLLERLPQLPGINVGTFGTYLRRK